MVSLPGGPGELRAIFEDHLDERFRNLMGSHHRAECQVPTPVGDESMLGALVERAMKRVPGVYMKTLPKSFGPEVRIEAAGREPQEVADRLGRAEAALREEVEKWQRQRG